MAVLEYTYDDIKGCIAKGRNKKDRPLQNNTRAVTTMSGVGIKLHQTIVVEFYEDGTRSLWTGGYQTRTTMDRLNRYSGGRIFSKRHKSPWGTKSVWYVWDGTYSPTKGQKCRSCSGRGEHPARCTGWVVDWNASCKLDGPGHPLRRHLVNVPCEHARDASETELSHIYQYDCYRCAGSGIANYGGRMQGEPFSEGILLGTDGAVVGATVLAPMQVFAVGSPKMKVMTAPVALPVIKTQAVYDFGVVVSEKLKEALPDLHLKIADCPICDRQEGVMDLVVHLNDRHKKDRRFIADWLRRLEGVDLTFKVPQMIQVGTVGEPDLSVTV